MTDQIRTITDAASIEKIFRSFFQNNFSFLKTKQGDLKIQFFGYSEGSVAFKIPRLKNIPEKNLIFARHADNTVYANVKFIEKQDDGVFLFTIDKIQMITRARCENRKSLDETSDLKNSKNIIFITNLISDSIIVNSLSHETKKIDWIKDTIKTDMSQAFSKIKIFFCNEGKNDVRMLYFNSNIEPLFIPDINNKELIEANEKKYNLYINNIYSRDPYLQNRKEYISEISIPILYKFKLPYGYIQVNNSNPLTKSMLSIVKKFAALTDDLFNKNKVFPTAKDKLIVTDLSNKGLGIAFREKKYIRYFKENNYVAFDILLPGNKIASIIAVVRNITIMENQIIKIGFSIDKIDALSEVNYEEFIDSLQISD